MPAHINKLFTLSDIFGLTAREYQYQTQLAAKVGLLLPAMAERPAPTTGNLEWHISRLCRAIELSQCEIYFDQFGRICGHVLWTCVSEANEQTLLRTGPGALDVSAQSSEGSAWILDMSVMYGELPSVLNALRENCFTEHNVVTYFRHKHGRRIAKRIAREDKTSFFQRRAAVATGVSMLQRKAGQDLLFAAANQLDAAIELGRVLLLLSKLNSFSELSISAVLKRVRTPLELMQRRLHLSEDGEPIAFLSWAWADAGSLHVAGEEPFHGWPEYKWNEGEDLLVCDAVAAVEGLDLLSSDLARSWFPTERLFMPATGKNAGGIEPLVCVRAEARSRLDQLCTRESLPPKGVIDVACAIRGKGEVECQT